MKVALFITCFNDTLFPDVGIATTRLLERLGTFGQAPFGGINGSVETSMERLNRQILV